MVRQTLSFVEAPTRQQPLAQLQPKQGHLITHQRIVPVAVLQSRTRQAMRELGPGPGPEVMGRTEKGWTGVVATRHSHLCSFPPSCMWEIPNFARCDQSSRAVLQ